MAEIRILVVDDHKVVRVGLRAMIEAEEDMRVVAEAADGAGAMAAFAQHRPDVTLLDLRLPDQPGADVIIALRKLDAAAKVIVLTSFDGDEDIYRAIEAGARGYLLKGTFPDGIL